MWRESSNLLTFNIATRWEAHLRKTLGETIYQELCQKHPHVGKPTRARLIAMEEGLPIPKPIEDILRWLANKPLS